MKWKPEKRWDGGDAFIIGGGPSLAGFDFDLLEGKNCIGCNLAFLLGEEIVPILYFTDFSFWGKNREEILDEYQGEVIAGSTSFTDEAHHWIKHVSRKRDGLHSKGHAIGWNYSTGASAIDLALRFGADRVFLLGVDLKTDKGNRMNWHSDNACERKDLDSLFLRFRRGFERVARDLPEVYPGRSVIQVNNEPPLDCFPSMGVREFLEMLNPPTQLQIWKETAKEDAAHGAFD